MTGIENLKQAMAKKHILLVDDDADEKHLFGIALSEVDPSILLNTASEGREALELLRSMQSLLPDVIFLDINMPFMNGWECLTKLKSDPVYSKIPVIIYSTSSNPRDIDVAKELGASSYCVKPIDYINMEKIILYVIEKFMKTAATPCVKVQDFYFFNTP